MKFSNDDKQNKIETEFLSLLFFQSEKTYPLIQIKPSYLLNPINQKIFELIIKSMTETGIVSGSYIINELQPHELTEYTALSDTDFVVPSEVEKRFIKSQEILLERYKTKIQEELITKFKNGSITREEFAKKTLLLQDVMLRKSKGKLTKEELLAPSKEKRIHLNNFEQLDKMLKLSQNDFLVIGAGTGTGKSALMLNFMVDLMDRYQCLYLNMEMSPETVKDRLKAIVADIWVDGASNPNDGHQKDLVTQAVEKIANCGIYLEHEITELEDIENYIKAQKGLDGRHTVVFIDHLGLIGVQGIKNIYEKTTFVMKRLRQLCLKYDCTIISASQLNRMSYNAEELDLSMLKDSGEVENSASKVIMLYRHKDYSSDNLEPKMILNICKNRNGQLGKIPTIYDKKKQKFKEKGYSDK